MLWILTVVVLWLTVVTVSLLLMRRHYKRLVAVGGRRDLQSILEKVLDRLEEDRIDLSKIGEHLDKLDRQGEVYIQKVGLLRFNPFPDTGGDQSFILALLDRNNNGVVISSLHTRTTTRWYAKKIVNGRASDVELSKEEEKAIKQAGKQN